MSDPGTVEISPGKQSWAELVEPAAKRFALWSKFNGATITLDQSGCESVSNIMRTLAKNLDAEIAARKSMADTMRALTIYCVTLVVVSVASLILKLL